MKGATSLLVLATVRRAADESAISRATVEGMFREADVNNDGEITFQEWFQWLGSTPSSGLNKSSSTGTGSSVFSPSRSTGSPSTSEAINSQNVAPLAPSDQQEKKGQNQNNGLSSSLESESTGISHDMVEATLTTSSDDKMIQVSVVDDHLNTENE